MSQVYSYTRPTRTAAWKITGMREITTEEYYRAISPEWKGIMKSLGSYERTISKFQHISISPDKLEKIEYLL